MNQQQYSYGMVGLGTMGCNLVLNMSDHGFSVAGYDKDAAKVEALNKYATEKKLSAFSDITSFLHNALLTPNPYTQCMECYLLLRQWPAA